MDHHGYRCRAGVGALLLVDLEDLAGLEEVLREAQKVVQHSLEAEMVGFLVVGSLAEAGMEESVRTEGIRPFVETASLVAWVERKVAGKNSGRRHTLDLAHIQCHQGGSGVHSGTTQS